MKRSRNNFDTEQIAKYYVDATACWWCQITKPNDELHWNYGNALHHILGRRGHFNNSILNSFFINNEKCHIPNHPILMKKENQIKMLEKTLQWLYEHNYVMNDDDYGFIEEHKDYYESILKMD
jgi:hypothetical protein